MDVSAGLDVAAQRLSAELQGTVRYGWNKKSAGARVRLVDGQERWLKVQHAEADAKVNARLWDGEVAAGRIDGVTKPMLHVHFDWESEGQRWRALLFDLVEQPVCSDSPELRAPLALPPEWFAQLSQSLSALARQRTERVNTRQELVTRRIGEWFGANLDTMVATWVVAHGDLHWANLTAPRLTILDWEGWGLAPRGLDAAILWLFSLLVPENASTVRRSFHDELASRDGRIATLFVCAELLRMINLYGDHPDLKSPLEAMSQDVLTAFRAGV